MHRPYISKRYGNLAIKISFENGELLLVKGAQEIVAGVIIYYKVVNGIPKITQLGVLRGEFGYVNYVVSTGKSCFLYRINVLL